MAWHKNKMRNMFFPFILIYVLHLLQYIYINGSKVNRSRLKYN